MAQPAVYTHGHHASVLRSHSWRTAANSAAYLVPLLRPGMRVLDVGCGPGTITADFAALVGGRAVGGASASSGEVIGLDAEASVLEGAQATAAERGLANVTFVTGDAMALQFEDDSFDVVHAHQVLQHVSDPVAVLREMRRVARPGGIVAARDVDFASTVWYPESPGLKAWLQMYSRVHCGNGGQPDAGRRLHVWAREAGFASADISRSAGAWCYSGPEQVAWWGGLWAERTLESKFAVRALDGGHASREELEAAARAWREWAAEADEGWIAMLNGEVICRKV